MKKPPHEPQTERALIGAMLYGTPANFEAFELLGDVSAEQWQRSPFLDPKCAALYAGMRSLDRKNGRLDAFTVAEELRSLGLDKVCSLADTTGIQVEAGSTAVITNYAKIVTEHFANREIIRIGQDMQSRVYEAEKDSTAIIESIEQQLFALRGLKNSKGVQLGSVVNKVIADATTPQVKIKGVSTGIKSLDQITGGFRETNFIVLAARTSECKSTAAIAFSLACALSGKHVIFFSMEMSEEEIVAKCLANLASIDSNVIEQGMVNGHDVPGLQAAGDILRKLPMTLYCEGAVKADDIRSKVRYHLGKGKVGLVVADYIQLMNGGKQGTREREVSVSSNALKAIAMDLKPPVLGLAQLSREVVKRGGPPGLIDLRESGSLEQDPNKVIFNYFPEREAREESKYDDVEQMMFIVAKNRGGKLGTVPAVVDKRYSRFSEPEIHVPAF
jgi:replicative DNA helicase